MTKPLKPAAGHIIGAAMIVCGAFTTGVAAQDTAAGPPDRPWTNRSLSPDARAALVVAEMTEDEKFAWLSGPVAFPVRSFRIPEGAIGSAAYYPAIPRLGIPAQQQSDASLGVADARGARPGDNATASPSTLLIGASFDPVTAREVGVVVGQEAHAKGFNVQLAGGANLLREPRGGRNFEYVSEDPLLTGVMVGNAIAGIQSQAVVSTIKHFVLNAQETGRVVVSSDIALGALHESDLLAFQIGIEIGRPGAVMTGYNLVNGVYASEDDYMMDKVLKGEWRYPGWVMTDWGATHSTDKAVMAGSDVQSGANIDFEHYFGAPLRASVAAGRVPGTRIDDMVRRQLRSLFAVGAIDRPARPGGPIDYMANRLVVQRAAERGIVLLKNQGDLLPAAKGARRLLVIGRHADAGVLSGGGSSTVKPVGSLTFEMGEDLAAKRSKVYHPSSPLDAIRAEANAAEVAFVDGTDVGKAVSAARTADMVVVFAEEWRTEGVDRPDLNLPDGQNDLIDAVATANPRTVVVIESGGPVAMPWLEKVPAVLAAFYPGSGGGEAMAGILFGRVNPSGRLPMTFPRSLAELPHPRLRAPETTTASPGTPIRGGVFSVDYDVEGSDVGYRWYERRRRTPLFPFGHGLSYTRFETSDLSAKANDGSVKVSVTIHNVGDRTGTEVAQLYVGRPGQKGFVPRLAGFDRVTLSPGQSRRVDMQVDRRLLGRFDAKRRRWVVAEGRYDVRIAKNAADAGLATSIQLPSGDFPS